MLPKTRNVVSPAKFKSLFDQEVKIAEFTSVHEKSAYEKRDSFLIHLIKRSIAEHFEQGDDGPYVLEDWWPDHTRYLELAPLHTTKRFLTSLHDLLTEEFAHWRIQLCVYEDSTLGDTYIGSMVLYADHILVETKLDKRLRDY